MSKDLKGSQGGIKGYEVDFKWVSGYLRGFQGGQFMIWVYAYF
jgi:hypothetical protein